MNASQTALRGGTFVMLCFAGLLATCLTAAAIAAPYSVTVLNGVQGTPVGLNDAGQVISTTLDFAYGTPLYNSYLWTAGSSQRIGGVGGLFCV